MKTNYQNLSMLDIVFEHRNKAYGAYVLRRDYDKSLLKAVGIAVSSVLLLLLGNLIVQKLNARNIITEKRVELTLHEPPVILQPKPKEQPKVENTARPKPTIKNPEMNVVAAVVEQDTVPDKDLLAQVDPGLTTNLDVVPQGVGIENGQGNEDLRDLTPPVPVSAEPTRFPDVMPEFPGGYEKLKRFLVQHTQYPDRERELGIAGKVITEFTVNEDGSVTDVKVIRSLSRNCDNEVTRVVKMLPKFKPGMQGGRNVKVRYVLPVTFTTPD